MKIEKITKLKNDKYKIKFENEEITTYDEVIINNNILYKKVIDNELYKKIVNETEYYDNYNKALKYALKKVRSIYEMKEYINKMNLSNTEKNKIIDKLANLNIVNDLMFTKALINDRMILGKVGVNSIIKELNDNRIDNNIIENEISKIDLNVFDEKLEKLIKKRINSNHKYSNNHLKKRIMNEMINLGYDKESINELIDKHLNSDYEYLIKEYNKIYQKYSKKYSDSELIYKIKNSLYSKGFNYEDIKKEDLL